MNGTVVAAIVAALAGPLLAYFIAVKKLSGKIATSEASDLWAESREIRKEYAQQIADQVIRIQRLEKQVDELTAVAGDCAKENRRLEGIVADQRAELGQR